MPAIWKHGKNYWMKVRSKDKKPVNLNLGCDYKKAKELSVLIDLSKQENSFKELLFKRLSEAGIVQKGSSSNRPQMSWQEAKKTAIDIIVGENRQPRTIDAIQRALKEFERIVKPGSLAEIGSETIRKFIVERQKEGDRRGKNHKFSNR